MAEEEKFFEHGRRADHPCYVGELHRVVSRPLSCSLQCEDLIARVCLYRKEVFFLFEMLAFAAATGALHKCVVGWNMPSSPDNPENARPG